MFCISDQNGLLSLALHHFCIYFLFKNWYFLYQFLDWQGLFIISGTLTSFEFKKKLKKKIKIFFCKKTDIKNIKNYRKISFLSNPRVFFLQIELKKVFYILSKPYSHVYWVARVIFWKKWFSPESRTPLTIESHRLAGSL